MFQDGTSLPQQLIVELVDADSNVVLDTKNTALDFTNNSTAGIKSGVLLYAIEDIDGTTKTERNFFLRARTDTSSVGISDFKSIVAIEFEGATGTSDIISFADLTNDTAVAGADGKEVIDNLKAKDDNFEGRRAITRQ